MIVEKANKIATIESGITDHEILPSNACAVNRTPWISPAVSPGTYTVVRITKAVMEQIRIVSIIT